MHRKILGLCAALVAFGAFAVMPAIGSAATLTETVGGVTQKVAVGSKITAEGTGTVLVPGAIALECNENVLTGTVVKNSGGVIEATLEDAWFQSNLIAGNTDTECKSALGQVVIATNLTNKGAVGATVERQITGSGTLSKHWCVVGNAESDSFQVFGRNCGEAGNGEFRISLNFTGGPKCGFKRTTSIPGAFNTSNTHSEVAKITITPNEQVFVTDGVVAEHSIFCPAELKFSNFVFDLYTDNNTTPTNGIHPVPVNKTAPLYISSP